jgi:hypothetical protein
MQPERDYRRLGLQRGALYEVTDNGPGNRLTVRGEKGEVIQFSPMIYRRLSTSRSYPSSRRGTGFGSRGTTPHSTSRTATASPSRP